MRIGSRKVRAVASVALIALAAALGCPSSGRDDDILTSGKKLYSQFNEELIIRHFFRDREGGVFVDVGSYHYRDLSNTFYLEKHLGWSGIAVDALAELAEGYEKNRPRTRFFNFIVTDHSGTMDTLYASGAISSTQPDHLDCVYDWAMKRAQKQPGGSRRGDGVPGQPDGSRRGKPPPAAVFKTEAIKIPTITLTELLDQNGVSKVDFLSMDIEQGEPSALAGFDIERFKPDLVCIEAFEVVRDEIAAYFESHGYERIEKYREYDDRNWYYRPKDEPGLE